MPRKYDFPHPEGGVRISAAPAPSLTLWIEEGALNRLQTVGRDGPAWHAR